MTGPKAIESADARNLCGMKDCPSRAISFFAWPAHLPIPLCQECGDALKAILEAMEVGAIPELSPLQWGKYARSKMRNSVVRAA